MVSGTITVSSDLIHHVRSMYSIALEQLVSERSAREGINGCTDQAIPAYILAVASVEAFLNEFFLKMAQSALADHKLWTLLPTDWLEELEIEKKLVLVPHLLFGRSFERSVQPYQDMSQLIKVRNTFVHFKMQDKPPRFFQDLQQKRIALRKESYPWPTALCTSEGIRWAHNTACSTVHGLLRFVTPEHYRDMISNYVQVNFCPIRDAVPTDWLSKHGITLEG